MFEKFKMMEPLFEDQVHERDQFSLVIGGKEYTGVLKDEEIMWYHPQPHQELSEQRVKLIEAKVHNLAGQQY